MKIFRDQSAKKRKEKKTKNNDNKWKTWEKKIEIFISGFHEIFVTLLMLMYFT